MIIYSILFRNSQIIVIKNFKTNKNYERKKILFINDKHYIVILIMSDGSYQYRTFYINNNQLFKGE
jgi:hypothetical protein